MYLIFPYSACRPNWHFLAMPVNYSNQEILTLTDLAFSISGGATKLRLRQKLTNKPGYFSSALCMNLNLYMYLISCSIMLITLLLTRKMCFENKYYFWEFNAKYYYSFTVSSQLRAEVYTEVSRSVHPWFQTLESKKSIKHYKRLWNESFLGTKL